MKTHNFIIIILMIGFSSCDTKDGGNYPYKTWSMEIENSSNHLIQLKFYSYLLPNLNIDTTLSLNQRYILTTGDEDPLGNGPDYITRNIFDSSVVIFENGKKLIYTHNKALGIMNDSANNILLKENYLSVSLSGKKEVFRYVLDNSDYLKAEK